MWSETCALMLFCVGTLYILMKALNLPDDASFEVGSKLEL
jgi:hypothetical protein